MEDLKFNDGEFTGLLATLMQHVEQVQNAPPDFKAQEELVADEVVKFLQPWTQPDGPLSVRKINYVEGRSNVIVKYQGSTDKVVSFVGSHLDVVPASVEKWERDPFKLTIEGDVLHGRGVTDCLGHVAMTCILFKRLGVQKPNLKVSVVAVFIANEECSDVLGVGIDELEKNGELTSLKNGPLLWVDSADFGPTLGTGGCLTWELACSGKLFHSGVVHMAINAIELAMEATRYVQRRFHEDFAPHPREAEYKFAIGSTLKPTQISTPQGGLNQIPGECSVKGDIRITPFYTIDEVKAAVERYVAELDVTTLPCIGYGKFELPDEDLRGAVTLNWIGHPYVGVACNNDTVGHKALLAAVEAVRGEAKPFSLTGSLPIVADLKDAGYDVQITGFGRMSAYHAHNEFGMLSEFEQGLEILGRVVNQVDAEA